MNNRHMRELRKFLKQYKATPISEQYREQADRVTELIPALVDAITDVELDHMMTLFADYLMTSIISPPKELDVLESEQPITEAETTN